MARLAPRTTHHHGNLKEALVAYALEAAQKGTIEALSLREASRDLGVSPGAVYRHVADKDALMRLLAKTGFDMLAARFEAVMPFESRARSRSEAKARFVALASAYVDFAVEHYGMWRLMFGPYGRQNAGPQQQQRADTYDWLAKSLGELAAWGLTAKADPSAQYFAWTAIHGLSDLRASPAVPVTGQRELVQTHCKLIISALH